ncbi:MAG: hypothetical protein IT563_01600 [Alphaproteobacteria bacterium]|nr:hypothetical protein [Alphaproteobacteria bacterium]
MAELFEILPGLPPYGPSALPYPQNGTRAHSEGFVVRFLPGTVDFWVGNFQRFSNNGHDLAIEFFDSQKVLVVAGGEPYLVDTRTRALSEFPLKLIVHALEAPDLNLLIFGDDLGFAGIDASGVRWRSPRISWDGLRNIRVAGEKLYGEAFTPDGDTWHRFELNLQDGTCKDSIYAKDMSRAVLVTSQSRLTAWLHRVGRRLGILSNARR